MIISCNDCIHCSYNGFYDEDCWCNYYEMYPDEPDECSGFKDNEDERRMNSLWKSKNVI